MYRLTQREGRMVQVSYDNGKTWKSTGCRTIAEAEEKILKGNKPYLKEYAKDFFQRKDNKSYRRYRQARNMDATENVYRAKQTYLDKYILKRFGNYRLDEIKARDIEDWFLTVKAVRHDNELSPVAKNLLLVAFRQVLDRAVVEGHIDTNPARAVKPISYIQKKKKPISQKELMVIFPNDDEELKKIWGIPFHIFFMIFRETGFRPGEILALRYSDIRHDGSVYTTRSYDHIQNKFNDTIKTTNKGKEYKVGFLSKRTLNLIGEGSGQIFDVKKVNQKSTNLVFKAVVKEYLNRTDISQYILRHAFMTELIGKYQKETIMELMGHTTWEKCYDDRTPEMIIENLRKALSRYQG